MIISPRKLRDIDPYLQNVSLLVKSIPVALGNATFTEESQNGNNGYGWGGYGDVAQCSYGPYVPTGFWSAYFDGYWDYISAPHSGFSTGDFTIEGWIFPISRTSGYATLFSNFSSWTSGNGAIYIGADRTDYVGKYTIGINGTFPAITSTASVVYNQWSHYALVRSGSTVTLYINGVANGTATSSATLNGIGTAYVGISGDSVFNNATNFNGYISNFRIVTGTAVYTTNFAPPLLPLTAIPNTTLLTLQNNTFKDNSSSAVAITATPPLVGQVVSYSVGGGGGNSAAGGTTTATFQGITLYGYGGAAGNFNNGAAAAGGGGSVADGSATNGGNGAGAAGDVGGGGGGSIGGGSGGGPSGGAGGGGAQSIDVAGLQAVVTAAGYSWTGPGGGNWGGSVSSVNANNGGSANGFGCGGGGAGWYGGNGGNGRLGGGGGGAAGFSAFQSGGSGGGGAVVLKLVGAATQNVVLTSGSGSYTIPAGTTSITIWAIGGGGGGSYAVNNDTNAGGGGGAGGVAYRTWTG